MVKRQKQKLNKKGMTLKKKKTNKRKTKKSLKGGMNPESGSNPDRTSISPSFLTRRDSSSDPDRTSRSPSLFRRRNLSGVSLSSLDSSHVEESSHTREGTRHVLPEGWIKMHSLQGIPIYIKKDQNNMPEVIQYTWPGTFRNINDTLLFKRLAEIDKEILTSIEERQFPDVLNLGWYPYFNVNGRTLYYMLDSKNNLMSLSVVHPSFISDSRYLNAVIEHS